MNQSGPENPSGKDQAHCFCGAIRRGLQEAAEMLTPPERAVVDDGGAPRSMGAWG